MSLLLTLSDLTWSLGNNLTGWFGLDWTVNLLGSLLKRLGDQHALREFGSSEFVSAKYSGHWGRRRGGLLSPRGNVWTFQHLVWSSAFDFAELRVAHVIVPDETEAAKIPRLTQYGTVLLVEPLGTLDGKKIDIDPAADNLPFLLRGSAVPIDGLRGWTRTGGRAEPVYPGSLVPHFPAGGIHLDRSGSRLQDAGDAERHGGQVVGVVAIGGTTLDLVTLSKKGFGPGARVSQGDAFTVEGDPQTYVATNTVFPVGRQVSNITFTPPAATRWKEGVDVDFRNLFTTPAPQACRVTELEPDATVLRGTIEPQALVSVARTALGIADGELFYVVDPAGAGQKAEVAHVGEGGGKTRLRLRGDDVPQLGRVSVKISGISPAALNPSTPALARADDRKLGVPADAPRYVVGDVLQLSDPGLAKPLFTAVTALAVEIEVDDDVAKLASSGTVALLAPVDGEAERNATLGEGGEVVDFKVGADPVGVLPAEGTVLGIISTDPGSSRIPAIVTKKLDDHRVKLDRRVGDVGDGVTVRTLTRTKDLGKDPKASGAALSYAPAASGTAPAAGSFVLVDAGKKAARRVTSVTFDGVLVDQTVPAAVLAPTAIVFRRRISKLDAAAQPLAPVWVLRGAAIDDRAKALALRGLTPMPPVAGTAPIVLPPGTTVTANVVTAPLAGAAIPAVPGVGSLLLATVGAASVLALVKQIQLDITLDRALPAEAGAAGLELVPLDAGLEYTATALDGRLVTVIPTLTGLPGVQVEMPRFLAGQLVLVTDAAVAPPVARSYRVAAVQGTTLTLEAGAADLVAPFPKPVTVRRLDARDPRTGTTRIGVSGTIPGADRTKVSFDVWGPGGLAAHDHVAVVDGARAFPVTVDTLDALRAALTTEAALADGAVSLDELTPPVLAFTTWASVVNKDGDDVVMDGAVVARAGAVLDVAVVPYVASGRIIPGRLSPGTVKVPDRLDDRYDLDRIEALIEHELHHTVQCAEMGPLLLSVLPMWAVELYAERKTGEDRARFTDGWKTYQSIIEASTAGGILELTTGSVYGALVWFILVLVHELNRFLGADGGGPLDAVDPFALDYFPALVPDATKPDITLQPLDGKTLTLAVGDRVQCKKPSDSNPLKFFSGGRTVKAVSGTTVTLDSGDLPLENGATAVARLSAAKGSPVDSYDNYVLRGLGLGWMSILFDPYGELDFRVSPTPGSFGDVLLRVGRYAFGTRSWGPVLLTGLAFADNLRRQWGFLAAKKPHLARMEMGASYASGDTYYPLGLLRASGGAATLLRNKQLVIGDVAQAWFVPDGGNRRDFSLVSSTRLASPGVPMSRSVSLMPFLDVPAVPNPAFPISLGAGIDPAVPQSGLAVPDVFTSRDPAHPLEPAGVPRQFLAGPRGTIPVSPAMERTAGMYVAFCQPGTRGATTYKHRFTVLDGVEGDESAREAFDVRGIDLIHDLRVVDVTVRVGGRLVADGADLALLPFERARVSVTPNAARRYDVTVTRPADGDIRRVDGDLSLQAAKTAVAEPVEVSRVYRYVDGKGFDGGGLATWGMHVPADVHIPVRRFTVKVDTVLPVRATADPDAAATPSFTSGQKAFVLVPSRLRPTRADRPTPTVTAVFTGAAPAGITVPTLRVDAGAVDPTADPKLSPMFAFGGRVLTIALPVDDPPEQEIRVDVSVDVGPDDANAVACTASFTVPPHFTLSRHGGGADFNVAAGATITLDCSGGVKAGKVTASPPDGITPKPTAGSVQIDVAAGTAAGPVRILVEDAADTTHTRKALRTITITDAARRGGSRRTRR